MSISRNVVIMTQEEHEAAIEQTFQRGVKRGREEERGDIYHARKPSPFPNEARISSALDAADAPTVDCEGDPIGLLERITELGRMVRKK